MFRSFVFGSVGRIATRPRDSTLTLSLRLINMTKPPDLVGPATPVDLFDHWQQILVLNVE